MGRKAIDLTGQKFGELTVLERAGSNSDKKALWLCKCSCGNTKIILGKSLRSGKVTNCGCKRKTLIKDLTNQVFGRLTVISEAGRDNNGKVMWKTRCICGNEKIVRGSDLLKGSIISCGCYKSEIVSTNLVGRRFGRLTVIKRSGNNGKQGLWLCECDCGNEIKVTTNHLITGNTQSCGCLASKGENQIALFLKEHNISFKQQFVFEDLYGKNNAPLRFDFAIFDINELKFLIEYQGIQHYQNIYKLPQEAYEYSLQRDEMKRQYCKLHNIPLIEIKYNENIKNKMEKIFNGNPWNNI